MNTTPLTFLERPAAGTHTPWLLVLMHGVGSNEQDLFGLAPYVPPHLHVLSLRAPFALGPGSYAWFEFDVRPDGSRAIDGEQELAHYYKFAEIAAGRRMMSLDPGFRLEAYVRDTMPYRDPETLKSFLKEINHFMRDWRSDATVKMDPRNFDIIAAAHRLLDVNEPYMLLSGYRSPATNAMLRSRSKNMNHCGQSPSAFWFGLKPLPWR